jgi:RNA-directed DNA polymerase
VPSTTRVTLLRLSAGCIFQSPAKGRNGRWAFLVSLTVHFSASRYQVLSAIYEQDFLPCSFGGRADIGAHHALATLNEVIAGKPVSWVLEADLKNFFGSLDHGWLLRFIEHRVGDPRIISLIRRWLKAGVLDEGELMPNEEGTPQGGSISVLLSNLYLHHVLDLWFERVVKPRLCGEAYLIRYIDGTPVQA